jgi:hypothetical protein
MGFRYLMSAERAEQIAAAVRHEHPRVAVAINAHRVSMYCACEAEANEAIDGEPGTPSWFESTPADEVAGHIDINRLLVTDPAGAAQEAAP